MVFSSITFVYAFFPLVAAAYYLSKNRVYRNVVLLLASLLFYSWGEPRFLLLMLAATLAAYCGGLLMERCTAHRKLILIVTVVLLVGNLFVFKYLNFFSENLSALFGWSALPKLTLPIGISFYTFQILSYVIDLYRGEIRVQRNYFYLLLYVSFFPQLIAGPIVRYSDIEAELHTRRFCLEDIGTGARRFTVGLGKKVLLANVLGELVSSAGNATVLGAWLGAVGYLLQIYFDFSGYSDMAIGLGRMFGFTFPENFDYPYLARSVTDFWRRWHQTLGQWFRDYVYIPLGGSRTTRAKWIRNVAVVWLLTGLWHGAAWQYVVFGLLHGIILCMERLGLRRALEQLPRLFRHLYTVVLLWLTLVIFGAPGLKEGLAALWGIFTWQSGAKGYTLAAFADAKLLLILAVSFLLCGPLQALRPKLKEALYARKAPSLAGAAGLLVLLFFGLMRVTAGTYSAFIYFQF